MPVLPSNYSAGDTLTAAQMNLILGERLDSMKPVDSTSRDYLTDTHDIGSSTYKWRHAYFSGNIAGTLTTAAQPNITSVGTLTGLTTTGLLSTGTSTGGTTGLAMGALVGTYGGRLWRYNADIVLMAVPGTTSGTLLGLRDSAGGAIADFYGDKTVSLYGGLNVGTTGAAAGDIYLGGTKLRLVNTSGILEFYNGSVNLFAYSSDTLKTDDNFVVAGGLSVASNASGAGEICAGSGLFQWVAGESVSRAGITSSVGGANKAGINFGTGSASRDTNLYRDSANVLKTDDAFVGATTIHAGGIIDTDDTTDSTSGTTGSIHTDGGVGVAKAIFVGKTATITSHLYGGSAATWSTGGETSPDVDAGGLCLNHGAGDGKVFTLKNSDVAHGVTDYAETDTYFYISKSVEASGGANLVGFNDAASVALKLWGVATTANTTTGTTGTSAVSTNAMKASGTGITSFAADDNIFCVQNAGSTAFIVKGDGDIYYDGADQGAYDAEDDLALVAAARHIGTGWDKEVISKHRDRLEELGIIQNGFVSNRKMTALQLGAIHMLAQKVAELEARLAA